MLEIVMILKKYIKIFAYNGDQQIFANDYNGIMIFADNGDVHDWV